MKDPAATYRFGKFALETRDRRLSCDGHEIYLRPKTYETLLYLMERHGHLVTKDELLNAVWADVEVTENALTRCVKEARAALGDEVQEPTFVRTIPRLGYEFIAEVQAEEPAEGEEVVEEEFRAVSLISSEEDFEGPSAAAPSREHSAPVHLGQDLFAVQAANQQRLLLRVGLPLALVVTMLAAAAILLHNRHHPPLNELDTVVLGDFDNTTGEPVFDDALKQGLAVQLEQSPFLNMVSATRVKRTLAMMGRSAHEPLNEEIGREVCQRTGSKVLLVGSIAKLGSQYVLGVKAVACASGDVLAQEQAQVGRKEELLEALGQMASHLRHRLGESLATVQKFDTPIAAASTSSLEALQAYSLGMKAFEDKGNAASIPFLERAIELDPNFAVAYAHLANAHENLGHTQAAENSISQAYQLRDRVTEVERFYIETHYYLVVSGELEKMIQVHELWERTYPRAVPPRVNQGVIYYLLGHYDKAGDEQREALRLNPQGAINYGNLADDYLRLDRLQDAEQLLQEAQQRKLGGEFLLTVSFEAAFLRGDQAAMLRAVEASFGQGEAEHMLLAKQSEAEAYYGQLKKAQEDSRRAQEAARRLEHQDVALSYEIEAAMWEAELGDRGRARQELVRLLPLSTSRQIAPIAALAWARIGDANQAWRMAQDLGARFPNHTLIHCYWLPTIEAAVALRHNDPVRALDRLRSVKPYELSDGGMLPAGWNAGYPIYLRGEAYLMNGDAAPAAAEFQRLVDHPGWMGTSLTGPLAYLGVARAWARSGNRDKSRQAYERLFRVWRSADPELPLLRKTRADYAMLN